MWKGYISVSVRNNIFLRPRPSCQSRSCCRKWKKNPLAFGPHEIKSSLFAFFSFSYHWQTLPLPLQHILVLPHVLSHSYIATPFTRSTESSVRWCEYNHTLHFYVFLFSHFYSTRMFRQQQLINPCASLSRSFVWVRIYADMGHASECEGLFRAQLCACERTKRGKIFIRAENSWTHQRSSLVWRTLITCPGLSAKGFEGRKQILESHFNK